MALNPPQLTRSRHRVGRPAGRPDPQATTDRRRRGVGVRVSAPLAPRSGALRCGLWVEKRPQNASLPACLTEGEVVVRTKNDRIW